ncbi:hypothetical protein PybrP1_008190 [[Pythium] brassicae (nom. inval.)]|nr:hypothetical protein PybrP1_008190 [[Pythium] brassicae (nom. inval.)]
MKFHREVLNDVWMQFLVILLLIALSVDSLNPIKAISGYLGVPSYYWGVLGFLVMLAQIWTNLADVIYRCTRVFLHSILSISFKSIDIVGLDNIPSEGPIIFTGNHANQFVDGLVVMMTSPRKVGFLIAEKSWHMPVVGDFARIMGCIPVVRPQDSVLKGVGLVKLADAATVAADQALAADAAATSTTSSSTADDASSSSPPSPLSPKRQFTLVGEGTSFTKQVTPGDQIRFQGASVKESGAPVKIVAIVSDTELVLDAPLTTGRDAPVFEPSSFGILKRVDQSVTFAKVYTHLKRGHSIGIFPEGGSHDRTDLLPLKAGVGIMALGVKDAYNITAHVVPVGLSYFRGHRFRGRVTVEFGTPLTVDEALMKTYAADKRAACNEFLHRVEDGMRSVIVTTPDYHIMQLVFVARRLFQRSGVRLSARETQDLNRRFAEGYKLLSALPAAAADLAALGQQLDAYNRTLKKMGLKDHQVPFISWWTIHDVLGSALYGFLIFALASIPSFVLNAPVGFLARYVALGEQKKALEGSKVKVAARDVLLSKKIQFSMVAVPALWCVYLLAAIVLTDWYWSSIFLLLLSFPLFSFFGVRSVEAGIIEFKTIRPLFFRLLPEHKKTQDELPKKRVQLQHDVRAFVHKYRAPLGKLAEPARVDWHEYMHSVAAKAVETTTAAAEAKAAAAPSDDQRSRNSSASSSEENERDAAAGATTTSAPHAPTITADHDLSILKKSDKSVLDLAGMERSMSCPPGFQEVLQQQMALEQQRLKDGRAASAGS